MTMPTEGVGEIRTKNDPKSIEALKQRLSQSGGALRRKQELEESLEEQEQLRQEIEQLKPDDFVQVICMLGKNRSRLVAEILENWGYKAAYGGTTGLSVENQITGELLMERDPKILLFATGEIKRLFDENIRPNWEQTAGVPVLERVLEIPEPGNQINTPEFRERTEHILQRLGFSDSFKDRGYK